MNRPDALGWQTMTASLLRRVQRDLHTSIEGLSTEDLNWRIDKQPNSIGWLAWHLTRSHDRNLSEMAGRTQLWIAERWHERFDRLADPTETGYGHTFREATSFVSPSGSVVLRYHDAVVSMGLEYLASAPHDEAARATFSPTLNNTHSVHDRLVGVIVEGLEHIGQTALMGSLIEPQLVAEEVAFE